MLPVAGPSVSEARRHVKQTLRERHVLPDVIDTACLLVSEVVGNAVRHARSHAGIELCIRTESARVMVSVHDGDPQLPDQCKAPPGIEELGAEQESGRGLLLLSSLADEWGAQAGRSGKDVWFTLLR
ncbi:ATP-binding protein [Streptomyces zagrosensis]|uniref:Anti-sigma regulatory factor (Ser/Thr protein kinase) n=1 Tax=Streptomyces zagrosensis TaxID=1042984 RepID=A0A7W9QGF9_9ACTN|nr:ATP-binding protein [Streptomyces zagrosensis]MBB5938572.1 anti-sigma regulatory factor (Ser/Thr protein kinase) [Streptomyces zagrosensis]